MGGLISALQSSSTALDAFTQALGVDQSNIANASTPGYAAQRAVILPIGTSGGGSKSAMPHEVTSYAADYRAFNAAACLRVAWESECHGGNTEKTRNQNRFFHKFLLVQALKPLRCPLVPARWHVFIFGRGSPTPAGRTLNIPGLSPHYAGRHALVH